MNAFVESYKLMTHDYKEVLDEFLQRVEKSISDNDVIKRMEKEKDKLRDMSHKINKLLDMHLEGKIDFDTYEKKREVLQKDI